MNKANECTCPSGDGSLVHPCPAHPAVEQAGTNVGHGHVFPRADGVKMRCGGPGLCSECTADASRARAALAQRSEFHQHLKECADEVATWPSYKREALTQPSPKCVKCGGTGEADSGGVHPWGEPILIPCDCETEKAEAERPEVVAVRYEDGTILPAEECGIALEVCAKVQTPLMTVAQHERIVGELRAVIAQLRQHKNDYMDAGQETYRALQNEIREREAEIARLDGLVSVRTAERDAALARVEQQERTIAGMNEAHAKLADLYEAAQTQHSVPVAREQLERLVRILDAHNYAKDAEALMALLAAAPAQAQHSVPEGWKPVPIEPLLNMMSDKDHDTRITAERQLLSILAAAPGNSVPQAWLDVQAERRRQITAEGWTPEHDDLYCAAELPRAAAAYILNGANDEAPAIWPFSAKWWKPRDARANYVRAAALILAEIERLDRAGISQSPQPGATTASS
ncbi:hypothetical protein [Pseudomonas aeruginosa]|uniref:hypothetical protein n=1 Tax=Pseudomonas aeruginosa TaxID=287 RepID=UPI00399681F7